ncbi:pullulanase [Bacillus sp. SA1-12]|uniref:DUF6509 family protein n=1 Tax=Bacillus sp. SA1-12 TaxID=1455638 RepID=UPI0006263000|nr:DUF6509 family protein [Bacillus sp. SA1-12]KKI93848.1 pullulanase [Bacillus sp. SA1-12]
MKIIESTIERLEDPFGILTGERFEIFLTLDIDEEDELYSENGIVLKLIYAVEGEQAKIAQYHFIEKTTELVLDFALEEDEEEEVMNYCKQLVEGI